jgi:hypothetical protein
MCNTVVPWGNGDVANSDAVCDGGDAGLVDVACGALGSDAAVVAGDKGVGAAAGLAAVSLTLG